MVVTGIFLSAAAGGSNSSVLTADSEADNDMDQEGCCDRPRCHVGLTYTLHYSSPSNYVHLHNSLRSVCTNYFTDIYYGYYHINGENQDLHNVHNLWENMAYSTKYR